MKVYLIDSVSEGRKRRFVKQIGLYGNLDPV